jgi:hypothetical protein
MKSSPKKQYGMTLISMACIGIVVGSIFFLAIAVIPIYIDHSKVTGALDSIKTTSEAGEADESPEQILTRLFKVLSMNNVDSLITKDNITVTKEETGNTKIRIEYEVVKKLVGNASILVQFDDSVDIANRGGQ